jgi:hypothetical protein
VNGAYVISGNAGTMAADYSLRYYSLKGSLLNGSEIKLDAKIGQEEVIGKYLLQLLEEENPDFRLYVKKINEELRMKQEQFVTHS